MTSIPPSTPPPPSGGQYLPPQPPGASPSSDRTIMIVLSYLGILALIPLIMKKDDKEIQWHAKNGLVLLVAYIIVTVLWTLVSHFLPSTLGCALGFVSCGIGIGYLVVIIMGILKGIKGERFRVPTLSDFADKF